VMTPKGIAMDGPRDVILQKLNSIKPNERGNQ